VEAVTVDGRTYYYHEESRVTRWDRPDDAAAAEVAQRWRSTEGEKSERAREALEAHQTRVAEEKRMVEESSAAARALKDQVVAWSEAAGWRLGKNKPVKPGHSRAAVLARLLATMDAVPGLPETAFPPEWRAVDPANAAAAPSLADVRKAYRAAAKTVHPDRLPAAAAVETRAACTEVFGVLSTAHGALQDE
jgi:WW domain